ncbi:MAG TPA: 6,7-dimethyl-8-ribityllumazine synthase, partial [Ferruginibacter sp.]|nr:6,7-dimethyl-8-ribityllumazine synthase [Ferruginibacter sp.]
MSVFNQDLIHTTGIQLPADACVVIVRTEWNAPVVNELESGAVRILREYGVKHIVLTVPGAFEIPFAIKKYAET